MRVIGEQWTHDIERWFRARDWARSRRKGALRHRTHPQDYGPGLFKRVMLPAMMSRKGPYTPMSK